MGDPTKISDIARNAAGTSALGPWALIRRAVGIPARNPDAVALEDEALRVMRETAAVPARETAPAPADRDDLARRMRAAGAPPERVTDWLQPRNAPADRFVAAWLADIEASGRPGILVLTGDTGAGKTVAALDALAWALRVKSRGPAHYATMAALLALGRWGDDGDAWDAAIRARFLLLDELAAVERGFRADRLEELLGARYDSGLPTVITTNLAPALLKDRRGSFGARVASRLGDRRACRIMECGTTDLRAQQRREGNNG